MRPVGDPDFVTGASWLEPSDQRIVREQIQVVSTFVLVPAYAAAIGCVKGFNARCDFVFFHGATIAAFKSRRI
jgi:hypothetical protein